MIMFRIVFLIIKQKILTKIVYDYYCCHTNGLKNMAN